MTRGSARTRVAAHERTRGTKTCFVFVICVRRVWQNLCVGVKPTKKAYPRHQRARPRWQLPSHDSRRGRFWQADPSFSQFVLSPTTRPSACTNLAHTTHTPPCHTPPSPPPSSHTSPRSSSFAPPAPIPPPADSLSALACTPPPRAPRTSSWGPQRCWPPCLAPGSATGRAPRSKKTRGWRLSTGSRPGRCAVQGCPRWGVAGGGWRLGGLVG